MEKVGDVVTFVDSLGRTIPALVTAWWGSPSQTDASINVVFVEPDSEKTDSYGRQISRATSVPHESNQAAPGNYWRQPVEA